jgi:tripartite-type tricarboxylate transporter receptor subunit TctC
MQRRILIQGAAATLALPLSRARAQGTWPTGPVRIIVGFPPGGGTDALARVVGQKLGVMWGHQVIVENKGGAAGLLAAEYVAQQPADGSALLMAHINSHALGPALQPGKLPAAIADKVSRDVNTVLAMADVQEKLDTYGAEDGGGTREKFAAFIASEQVKWARVVKDGNVRVESQSAASDFQA